MWFYFSFEVFRSPWRHPARQVSNPLKDRERRMGKTFRPHGRLKVKKKKIFKYRYIQQIFWSWEHVCAGDVSSGGRPWMKRTVWHHKEVFQSPPRGVFRSRFLWAALAVFTLRCLLIISRASVQTEPHRPQRRPVDSFYWMSPTKRAAHIPIRSQTMQRVVMLVLPCFALLAPRCQREQVLSEVSISPVMLA